jgi:rare lipoprotein A
MLQTLRQVCAVLALAVFAASCASEETAPTVTVPPSAGVYKVGSPYQIGDTWYYPHEQPDYDETGIASWYGPTFYGHHTADGEMYDPESLTAAHRTLPMPVNVRVTNLENGKSLVVRVNDRGPFARGRIIDLSEKAAKLLGVYAAGTARVRVTYVSRADRPDGAPQLSDTPPEIATAVPAVPTGKVDTAALDIVPGIPVAPPVVDGAAASLPAPPQIPPPSTVQPTGQVTQVVVPPITHLYVQAGAFGSYDNAARLSTRLGNGLKISSIQRHGQTLYRVRLGPFNSTGDADAALSKLGSSDAQIIVDQ